MESKAFADSVFAQGEPRLARGTSLSSVALAGVALAAIPVLLLLVLAWLAGQPQAPGAQQLRWLTVGIVGFIVLDASLFVWLGIRWVGRPLGELVTALRQIERGDYPRTAGMVPGRLREMQLLHDGLRTMWTGLERRRNERDAALLATDAARQEMHSVLDRMDEGFMIVDLSWSVKFCNQRATELVNRPNAQLDGLPFWDLFPDEKKGGRRLRYQREVENDRALTVEDFHTRYRRWFEIRMFPAPGGIGVFIRDVSERRRLMDELLEREQRYRELFEANPNVMWIFDTQTLRFLAVNTAAIERYGYSKDEFLAMGINDIRPQEDRQELIEEVRRYGAGSAHRAATLHDAPRIWRHVTKAGDVILVEIARHPVTFQGRPARLVMVSDVTGRLLGESRLQRSHDRLLAEHSQTVRALAAAQQAAAGYARLLQGDLLPLLSAVQDAPAPAPLQQQAAQVERLLREVQRLAQVPAAPFQREEVALSELALAEIHRLRLTDPQRRVHVEVEPQLACEGDAALLRLLLHALLENAWKFSQHGRNPWIRMGRLGATADAPAAFFISDNGIGFDDAMQGRLYQPFERLHSDAEYAGHGLGLALARAVVERHGGRLWARAAPGQGATFFFQLEPRAVDPDARVSEVVIDSPPPQDE